MKVNQSDLEYITDTSEAVLRGIPVNKHLILWAAVSCLIILVLWAHLAVLDEVTTGEGKVIPSSEIQTVQNLEGGIVKKLNVRVGDVVEKNQIIMLIDDTRFASSFRETEVNRNSLQAAIARLIAETESKPLVFPVTLLRDNPDVVASEKNLYNSRQAEMNTKLDILNNELRQEQQELAALNSREKQLKISYDLVHRELILTKPLVRTGAVSEVELLRLERSVNDLKGERDANLLAIPRVEARISAAKNKIEEYLLGFRSEALRELNEAQDELNRQSESKAALEDRVARTFVRSPVRGTINKLYVNTIGGIVQPGEKLIDIVPLEDSLLVEAKIRPQDIGFLRPGLDVKVKLTAYDFAIYGGLEGILEHISADTIMDEEGESFYQIRVRTKTNYIGTSKNLLAIIPGMRATVDILTGHKTVLDYILKPILKTKQNALRER